MSYASQVRTYRAARNRSLSPIVTKLNEISQAVEDGKLNADGARRARKPLLQQADAACMTYGTFERDLLTRAHANAVAMTPAVQRAKDAAGDPHRAAEFAKLAELASPAALLSLAGTLTADDAAGFALDAVLSRRAEEPGIKEILPKLRTALDSLYDKVLGDAVADFTVAKHEAARAALDVDGYFAPSNIASIMGMDYAANLPQVEGCPLSSVTTDQAEGFHSAVGMGAARPHDCQLPAMRPGALTGVRG